MSWQRGRYYVRSVWRDGRAVNEYVGGGELGTVAAKCDVLERSRRQIEVAAWRDERERKGGIDGLMGEVCDLADVLLRVALAAAGYHQHDRGEWRKRRVRNTATGGCDDDSRPDEGAGEGGRRRAPGPRA
jgi:hypothetical protein